MQYFHLHKYTRTALPLAVWLEKPIPLYQEPHHHDCCEIVFICTGTGWAAVNGQRSPILVGDVYVLTPSDLHEFSSNPGLMFYNIMFSPEIFSAEEKALFAPLLTDQGRYTVPPAQREQLMGVLSELVAEIKENRPGVTVAARALFVRFMVGLLRHCTKTQGTDHPGEKHKMISRIFDLISRRYCEKLSLYDLAEVAGCSPEYAGRLFKSLTGITFTAYLNRYRIDMACCELEKGERTISEIAADLGYFDTAYFDKCFSRIIGMSPLAYRKRFAARPRH